MAFVLCLSDKLERRPFQYNKFILNKNNTNNIREKRFIKENAISSSSYTLDSTEVTSVISNNDLIEPSDIEGWTNYLTNVPIGNTIGHLKSHTLAPNGIDFKTSTKNSGNNELYSIASYKNIFNAKENVGSLFTHVSLSDPVFIINPGTNYAFNTVDGFKISGGNLGGSPENTLAINGMQVSNINLEGMRIIPGSNETKNTTITTNVFTFNNCDIDVNIQSNTGGILKGPDTKLNGKNKIYGNIIVENTPGIMPDAEIIGNAFFTDGSTNNGIISKDAIFTGSENGMNGLIKGNAFFIDNSVNRGIIYGNAAFDSTSANSGIVLGDTITITIQED
jgi:hypothetical protein